MMIDDVAKENLDQRWPKPVFGLKTGCPTCSQFQYSLPSFNQGQCEAIVDRIFLAASARYIGMSRETLELWLQDG